ncbi:MAG: diguanylate cyclase (GGDEF)-like protein [Flavobacteriales bacterium]
MLSFLYGDFSSSKKREILPKSPLLMDLTIDSGSPAGQVGATSSFDLLDAMQVIILVFDRWGCVSHANKMAVQWKPQEDFLGKSFAEIADHWDDPYARQREITLALRTGRPHKGSLESVTDTQGRRWFRVDKIPTKNSLGEIDGLLLILNDVSQTVSTANALRHSEDRYRAFIANSTDAIWCYELCPPVAINQPSELIVSEILERAAISEGNEKLAEIFGVKHIDQLIGLRMPQYGSLTDKNNIEAFVAGNFRLEEQDYRRITRRGDVLYMQSSAIGIVEDGHLLRAWGTTRDVTEKKRYLDKMEFLATHDSLTGLPNRALLYRKVEEAFKNNRANSDMALLLIDLDRFKEINDTLGHIVGDKVLKQLGPRLEQELGDMPGIVARLGGDEFAIFLPKIRNHQHAVVMAHRFLDAICQAFDLENFQTEISASIGVSLAPRQATDISTLMRYADVAMYHAKTHLKGISIYDPGYDSHSPKRLELMGALGRAIREGQLFLEYQPKVDLLSDKIYGVEALVRWMHPQLGRVPPAEFVPIAEMSNMIYPMSLWVLEHGVRQCAQWRAKGLDLSCAVNLSARNLMDDRIVSDLARLLKDNDVPGHCIEVEITESSLMIDPERAQATLMKIHDLDVGLSIDDFGTGYSSLAYLKRLPVGTLKIDCAFVQGMLDDDQNEIIVKSTIQLAHNLGLLVVAEGVETQDVYKRLAEMGCDNAQGYYIAKPLSVEALEQCVVAHGTS